MIKAEHYAKFMDNMPYEVSWRFTAKDKRSKLTLTDIAKELNNLGMGGCFYGIIFQVPEEFPEDDAYSYIDLYEPSDGAVILASIEGLKVVDDKGNVVKVATDRGEVY